jgi:hypothetical protein
VEWPNLLATKTRGWGVGFLKEKAPEGIAGLCKSGEINNADSVARVSLVSARFLARARQPLKPLHFRLPGARVELLKQAEAPDVGPELGGRATRRGSAENWGYSPTNLLTMLEYWWFPSGTRATVVG